MVDLGKTIGHFFYMKSSFVHHFKAIGEFKQSKNTIQVEIGNFLSCLTLKFDRWPWKTIRHLLYTTSSFVHHFKAISEFKLALQSRNTIWVKISEFLSHVTLKFDRWTWKPIGHLFYTTSSFLHHLIAINEFKLELQSGNAQLASKSIIFCTVWPWNLTNDFEKQ